MHPSYFEGLFINTGILKVIEKVANFLEIKHCYAMQVVILTTFSCSQKNFSTFLSFSLKSEGSDTNGVHSVWQ